MRRLKVATVFAAAAVAMAGASTAWACVPGTGSEKRLEVSPAQVRPGESVTVRAPSSGTGAPVELRLDAVDGPLLGTLGPAAAGADGRGASTTFVVPLATPPGQHAVIAVGPGAHWEPAALAVAMPDGSVPATSYSQAPGGGGGAGPVAVVVMLAVALGVASGVLLLSRRRKLAARAAPGPT